MASSSAAAAAGALAAEPDAPFDELGAKAGLADEADACAPEDGGCWGPVLPAVVVVVVVVVAPPSPAAAASGCVLAEVAGAGITKRVGTCPASGAG